MPRAILELLVEAVDKASATLDKVSGKASQMGKAWESAAGAIRVGAIGGGIAVAGFAAVAVKAAAEDEAATARLTKALENYVAATGGAAEETQALTADMNERIAAGQRLAFSDDQIRDSMQALIASTGDYGEAAKRQGAAMDLARGAGISLEQATRLLGKLNSENIEVFKRMGIVIGENATEADALAAVQAKFGGQAETYAKSTAAQFEIAKLQVGELTESVGGLLLPVVSNLATKGVELLRRFSAWFEENRPQIEATLAAIGAAAGAAWAVFARGLETIWPIVERVFRFIFENEPILIASLVAIGIAVTAAFGPVGVATIAIVAFIALIGYLRDNWQEVLAAVTGFIEDHKTLIIAMFGPVGALVVALVHYRDQVGAVFKWVGERLDEAGAFFERMRDRVASAMDAIRRKVEAVYTAIKPLIDFLQGAAGLIGGGLSAAAGAFGLTGHAEGTRSAPGGLALVGEGGPEIVGMPRGARVWNARDTRSMLGGGGTTVVVNITQPLGTPEAIADAITAALDYNARTGRRVLAGA